MNPSMYIWFFLPFIIMISEEEKKKKITNIIKKRRTDKEKKIMKNYIVNLIGKSCRVFTISQTLYGVVVSVDDNAVVINTSNSQEIINLDFVIRISENIRKK